MTLPELKRRLRQRSEYALRLAALDEVGRRYPSRTAQPALPPVGPFWRFVFVPLFRRVPWAFRQRAMRRLKLTARGWTEDARRFGEPWRPPPGDGRVPAEDAVARASEAQSG